MQFVFNTACECVLYLYVDGCIVQQERHGFNEVKRWRHVPMLIDQVRTHKEMIFATMLADLLKNDREAMVLAGPVAAEFDVSEHSEFMIPDALLEDKVIYAMVKQKEAIERVKVDVEIIGAERRDTLRIQ